MDLTVTEGAYLVDLDDGLLTLTFNRPEARNAIPTEAILRLAALFEAIASNSAVRVVLVIGKGEHFGGGGDVAGMKASLDLSREERGGSYWKRLNDASRMVTGWARLPQPTVVACRGAVAGAAMMYPLWADFAYADQTAFFLCAHQQLGLTPDSGLSYFLPRALGTKRANELMLGGHRIDAMEALRIGVISEVVAAEELEARAIRQARRLAAGPRHVLREAKRMIRESLDHGLDEQLAIERDMVAEVTAQADFEEGVTAFMEKRRPVFPSARADDDNAA